MAAIAQGIATISVIATDPGGLSATHRLGVAVHRPSLVVNFATHVLSVREGDTVVLEVVASAAPDIPVTVWYSLGADSDPATDDADQADYAEDAEDAIRGVRVRPNPAGPRRYRSADRAVAACSDVQSADLASLIALRLASGGQTPPPTDEDEDIWLAPALYDDRETLGQQTATVNSAQPEPLVLQPRDFSGLHGLYYLALNGFHLTELPTGILADLSELGSLRVEQTPLTDFPWEELRHTPKLRLLDLTANRLSRIPSRALATLSDLWVLNLQQNEFTELTEGSFAGLSGLERLYLSMNPLKSLPPRIFADLGGLRRLSLHRIEAEELPQDIFSPLISLEYLNLTYSPLRTMPSLAGLTNLETVEINYNRLTDLPVDFFSGLEKLDWNAFHPVPWKPYVLTRRMPTRRDRPPWKSDWRKGRLSICAFLYPSTAGTSLPTQSRWRPEPVAARV